MMGAAGCLEQIRDADMVLVGLGEEFDVPREAGWRKRYREGRESLKGSGLEWLFPAWSTYCTRQEKAAHRLEKLEKILKEKNYFVVSVASNDYIRQVPWKNERLVMPCGTMHWKQCACKGNLCEVTARDEGNLEIFFAGLSEGALPAAQDSLLGVCRKCGSSYVLNNVYGERYDESGYLEQWSLYTKWLQGTLNRRLVILELGVGMQFPSVIRWPFERIAFLNQKATFWRVHESLYQLDEKLSGKGWGISQNAIDWLNQL